MIARKHAVSLPLIVLTLWLAFVRLAVMQDFGSARNFVELPDRVVVSAPVLVLAYGGDHYLAANLEVMRLAATGINEGVADMSYLTRAHRVVSDLNPCHEDNYYLANGLLTWSGAVSEGDAVLQRAMVCRFWDGMPAFFYGVNRSFFGRDLEGAVHALELAAERWPENAAALRKLVIMLQVDSFADEQLALSFLVRQRDDSSDPKLQEMLDKRVVRLRGLIALRAAHRSYEKKYGLMSDIKQLLTSHELAALPDDPLGLGYELRAGRIEFKAYKLPGLEGNP